MRSVVYFVRANIPNAQIIADQVKDLNRCHHSPTLLLDDKFSCMKAALRS